MTMTSNTNRSWLKPLPIGSRLLCLAVAGALSGCAGSGATIDPGHAEATHTLQRVEQPNQYREIKGLRLRIYPPGFEFPNVVEMETGQ